MVFVRRPGSLVVAAILVAVAATVAIITLRQTGLGRSVAALLAPSEDEAPPVTGVVAQTTKVWKEPGDDNSAIAGQIAQGTTVRLWAHDPDNAWYLVEDVDGVVGWTRATLLTIDPLAAARVPASGTSRCNCGAHAE